MAKKHTTKTKKTKKNTGVAYYSEVAKQDFLIITGAGFIVIALLMVFILR